MSGRRRVLTVAAALVSASAVGCTGLSVSAPDRFRTAAPDAVAGGRLVVGMTAPASVDPALVSDPAGQLIASLVCEPLIQLDPVSGKVARGMVDAMTITGRGAGLVVSLRKDIKMHDGSILTAQDVLYSLSRVARHDVASPSADVLAPIAGWHTIHAPLPPTSDQEPADRRLAGVRAISRYAFEVALAAPNAEFVRALSLPLAAPVPSELPDRDERFTRQPACAGPYRMARPFMAGDTTIELERFEDYYGRDEAYVQGGAGYPDTIEVRLYGDRESQRADFEAGVLDVAQVAPAQLGELRRTSPQHLLTAATPQVEYLGLPLTGPFADAGVRRALSAAIDRERLAAEVYGGGRMPADRFLPPALAGGGGACNLTGSADAEPAAMAELRSGPQPLYVNDDHRNRQLAESIAAQWRERLGLDVVVTPMPWTEYLAKATSPGGAEGMFRESWQPAYPSADPMLYPLFHSSGIGKDNFARYNSRTFDRRIDRVARRETSEDLRAARYRSLEAILCEDLPLIPLTFGQEEYLVRTERVGAASGVYFDRTWGLPVLRELFIRDGGPR